MRQSLQNNGINYIHFPALGGRNKVIDNTDSKPFSGFTAYMHTQAFADTIAELQKAATDKRLAYMCAEANWQHCHRSLLSAYLYTHGWAVCHIKEEQQSVWHQTPAPKPVQGNLF